MSPKYSSSTLFVRAFNGSDIPLVELDIWFYTDEYGAGIPDSSYNYHWVFDIAFLYDTDSPPPPEAHLPIAQATAQDYQEYVLSYVRTVNGFESTDQVAFGEVTGILPTPPPTPPSTDFPVQAIDVSTLFLAYSTPGLTELPSLDDREALIFSTEMFYDSLFRHHANATPSLLYLTMEYNFDVYGAALPDVSYNYYLDFNMTFYYPFNVYPLPTPDLLYEIMTASFDDYVDYLVNYVTNIDAFRSTDAAVFGDSESLFPVGGYEPTLDLDSLNPSYHYAFEEAADKWSSVIIGDLPDVVVDAEMAALSICSQLQEGQVIDDVDICATIGKIDGPDNILGFAGPEYGREGNLTLPSTSYME